MSPDVRLVHPLTLSAIGAEVLRARIMHPKGVTFLRMLAALTEEVGEVAQAFLSRKPWDEIEKELIQVACVAARMVEECSEDPEILEREVST